jgi:gluconolactonase
MTRRFARVLLFITFLTMICCSQPTPPPPSQQAAPSSPPPSAGSVVEKDPALKAIVPLDARVEKLADGFVFTEGPVWVPEGGGALLFSDIPNNRIMKWTDGMVTEFRKPSGYTGPPAPDGSYVGSNGLTLDKEGRQAHHLRAWRPACHAPGERRQSDRIDRQVSRQTAEQSQ